MIAAAPVAIVVCDRCRIRTLDDALAMAKSGATIVVHGVQRGNFVVRRPLTIEGVSGALLDGQDRGTVLTIDAPNVTVRNLRIRSSGADFVAMSAGIRSNAPRTHISNVVVSDALFGVYLAKSDFSTVDNSAIFGRSSVDLPDRGDGLRVWYSHDVRLAYNRVQDARDDLIWFSNGVSVLHNTITGGRYGIHTMYSNGMKLESNVILDCQVGSYGMYGQDVRIEHNVFSNNRGSTGYGIGLKSMDDTVVEDNALVSNHAGVYLDNSPSLTGSVDTFERNLFAYNETGIAALPSSRNDVFTSNSFVQNYRQVSVLGGGALTQLAWSQSGKGNYWSDYAGFDRNADGTGDVAYRLRSVYGTLADLDERLDLLAYSPAAGAIDFAINALPLFAPRPILSDMVPFMSPVYPRNLPRNTRARHDAAYTSIGLLALAASFGVLLPLRPRMRAGRGRRMRAEGRGTKPAIDVANVHKRFGKVHALAGIDLHVARGETLALWGPNGSGKTTLMRCLLGIVRYEGRIDAPLSFGYVPQQLPAFDMRVREFVAFAAGLHGASAQDVDDALREADLEDISERSMDELSGGQRQRLAVAAANLGEPEALLLDEPTVGLDLQSRNAIIEKLLEAKHAHKTIIVSSHVPEDIIALADRVVIMHEGRIVSAVSPAEFVTFIQEGRAAS